MSRQNYSEIIPTLYHYTCEHGRRGLGTRGMLRPNPQPVLGGRPLIWLTDQSEPEREALGLTSRMLACDRLQFRYRVEADRAQRYLDWAARVSLPFSWRAELEAIHGVRPETWFVLESSALAILDRGYSKAVSA